MKSITAPGSTGPATKPLRIGLVTPAWPGTETANGIASAVSHLAGGLTAIGHEVTIIAHWVDAPHADPRVIAVDEKPLPLIGRLLFRLFPDRVIRRATIARMTKAVRQAIGRHRIDVLLMEESFGWAGALRRALPIPVIVTASVAAVHDPGDIAAQIRAALLADYGPTSIAATQGMRNFRLQQVNALLKERVPALQDQISDFSVVMGATPAPLPEDYRYFSAASITVNVQRITDTTGLWSL